MDLQRGREPGRFQPLRRICSRQVARGPADQVFTLCSWCKCSVASCSNRRTTTLFCASCAASCPRLTVNQRRCADGTAVSIPRTWEFEPRAVRIIFKSAAVQWGRAGADGAGGWVGRERGAVPRCPRLNYIDADADLPPILVLTFAGHRRHLADAIATFTTHALSFSAPESRKGQPHLIICDSLSEVWLA